MIIIFIIYTVGGYWACGKTIYADKIRTGKAGDLILQKIILGILFGIILIPAAFIKFIFRRIQK